MLHAGFDFRGLAREEVRKYDRRTLVAQAAALARDVRPEDFTSWAPSGIRAQLLDLESRKLEMDFRTEGDDRSFHVLNAVSPAFTCALPFSEHVCDQIDALHNRSAAPTTPLKEELSPRCA
jgi:L-2-hydroxyglutarate oxidase LhgO